MLMAASKTALQKQFTKSHTDSDYASRTAKWKNVFFFPFQIIWGLNVFIRMPCNYGFLKQYSITNTM